MGLDSRLELSGEAEALLAILELECFSIRILYVRLILPVVCFGLWYSNARIELETYKATMCRFKAV